MLHGSRVDRISINELLNPQFEDDVMKIAITNDSASSITESILPTEEKLVEEEDGEVLLTVAEKLDILARANTVLDSIISMPETVDIYFGRAHRLLRSEKALAARQKRIGDFFVKK